MTWGRNSEIIRQDGLADCGYLTAPEFYALVLKGLGARGRLPEVALSDLKFYPIEEVPGLFERLFSRIKQLSDDEFVDFGQTIMGFFKWCSSLRRKKGSGSFEWPEFVKSEVRSKVVFRAGITADLAAKAEKMIFNFAFNRSAVAGLDSVCLAPFSPIPVASLRATLFLCSLFDLVAFLGSGGPDGCCTWRRQLRKFG